MKVRIFILLIVTVFKIEFALALNNVEQFIASVTSLVIIPDLEESVEAARTLNESSKNFCHDPNSNGILETQSDWANAMQHWSGARLFKFGPLIEDNIDLKIHYLPIRKNQIKANLKTDLDSGEQLPVSARGLATIEYLLFDREKTSQDITDEFANAPKRCNYLVVLSRQLVNDNERILSDWSNSFAVEFNSKGEKITQPEALEQLFRSMISYFEATIKNRLGRPAGIKAEQPLPYKSESWRSGTSVDNMMAGIYTFGQLLQIDQGLEDFLKQNDQATLAEMLVFTTQDLRHSLSNVKPDLFTAVSEAPQAVKQTYDYYLQLTDTLKQAAKALNIQIGFNDQDGD